MSDTNACQQKSAQASASDLSFPCLMHHSYFSGVTAVAEIVAYDSVDQHLNGATNRLPMKKFNVSWTYYTTNSPEKIFGRTLAKGLGVRPMTCCLQWAECEPLRRPIRVTPKANTDSCYTHPNAKDRTDLKTGHPQISCVAARTATWYRALMQSYEILYGRSMFDESTIDSLVDQYLEAKFSEV